MPLLALFGLGLVGLGFAYSQAKKKIVEQTGAAPAHAYPPGAAPGYHPSAELAQAPMPPMPAAPPPPAQGVPAAQANPATTGSFWPSDYDDSKALAYSFTRKGGGPLNTTNIHAGTSLRFDWLAPGEVFTEPPRSSDPTVIAPVPGTNFGFIAVRPGTASVTAATKTADGNGISQLTFSISPAVGPSTAGHPRFGEDDPLENLTTSVMERSLFDLSKRFDSLARYYASPFVELSKGRKDAFRAQSAAFQRFYTGWLNDGLPFAESVKSYRANYPIFKHKAETWEADFNAGADRQDAGGPPRAPTSPVAPGGRDIIGAASVDRPDPSANPLPALPFVNLDEHLVGRGRDVSFAEGDLPYADSRMYKSFPAWIDAAGKKAMHVLGRWPGFAVGFIDLREGDAPKGQSADDVSTTEAPNMPGVFYRPAPNVIVCAWGTDPAALAAWTARAPWAVTGYGTAATGTIPFAQRPIETAGVRTGAGDDGNPLLGVATSVMASELADLSRRFDSLVGFYEGLPPENHAQKNAFAVHHLAFQRFHDHWLNGGLSYADVAREFHENYPIFKHKLATWEGAVPASGVGPIATGDAKYSAGDYAAAAAVTAIALTPVLTAPPRGSGGSSSSSSAPTTSYPATSSSLPPVDYTSDGSSVALWIGLLRKHADRIQARIDNIGTTPSEVTMRKTWNQFNSTLRPALANADAHRGLHVYDDLAAYKNGLKSWEDRLNIPAPEDPYERL